MTINQDARIPHRDPSCRRFVSSYGGVFLPARAAGHESLIAPIDESSAGGIVPEMLLKERSMDGCHQSYAGGFPPGKWPERKLRSRRESVAGHVEIEPESRLSCAEASEAQPSRGRGRRDASPADATECFFALQQMAPHAKDELRCVRRWALVWLCAGVSTGPSGGACASSRRRGARPFGSQPEKRARANDRSRSLRAAREAVSSWAA